MTEPEPDTAQPGSPPGALRRRRVGLPRRAGRLTALVSGRRRTTPSNVAERLGRYCPATVTVGGVSLSELPRATSGAGSWSQDKDPRSSRARVARRPRGARRGPASSPAAAHDRGRRRRDHRRPCRTGLDTDARPSAAARSRAGSASASPSPARCVADPEVLVLDEPTSAVDAHTEARIAERLRARMRGPGARRRRHHEPAAPRPVPTRWLSSSTAVSWPPAATASCSRAEPGYRRVVPARRSSLRPRRRRRVTLGRRCATTLPASPTRRPCARTRALLRRHRRALRRSSLLNAVAALAGAGRAADPRRARRRGSRTARRRRATSTSWR